MKKVYIYRVANHSGKKEYKRTKCSNYWTTDRSACWQFSMQGGKGILETLNAHNRNNFYSYGIEIIEA